MTKIEPIQFSQENINEDLANCTINNVSESIMITDSHHRIIYVNNQFEKIAGFLFDEIKGKHPSYLQRKAQQLNFYEKMHQVAAENDMWQGEIWNTQNKNSHIKVQYASIQVRRNKDSDISHYISIFSDLLDDEVAATIQSSDQNHYDPLTGLPNRIVFEKYVLASVNQCQKVTSVVAAIFFQLENFTTINEKYGLLFGDVILQRLALRLNQRSYGGMLVTRWDGTKFACILENVKDRLDVEERVNHIREKMVAPLIINGIEVKLSASFGAHLFNKSTFNPADFLSKANTALEVAQMKNKEIQFYEEKMGHISQVFIMEIELKRAIKEDQFQLFYQPLISVETGKLVGLEGLLRWIHPTEGMISPIKFIPYAEQTGLIKEIGDMVFEKACNQLVEWKKKGFGSIKLHVNMSMVQFENDNLVGNIRDILHRTGVVPAAIGVELTESSIAMNMEETIIKLNELSKLGLSIAIDDFGTGYSSFGYLIDFPIDRIKVDRSYIESMAEDNKISTIVKAISNMGRGLGVEVVAEGIETEAQLEQVNQLQFNVAQGYLFDAPLPIEAIEEKWLQRLE